MILGVEDPALQELLCDVTVKDGLSVRQLEEKLRRLAEGDKKKEKDDNAAGELPEEYSRVLEHIGKYFKEEISLKRTAGGKGSMTIKFSSDEEMQSFLKVLEDAQI